MFGGFGHGLRFSSFIILYGWCIPEVTKLIIRAEFCKGEVDIFFGVKSRSQLAKRI
jgi:hypothetical protein